MTGNFALVVDQAGATLEKGTHGTVVLVHADGRRERIGLRTLGAVVLHGDVRLSTSLLHALSSHNVSITLLPSKGYPACAGFGQLAARHAALRHRQHLIYADSAQRLALARLAVQQKIEAMMIFARKYPPHSDNLYLPSLLAAAQATDVAMLMGVEGAATLKHFDILSACYGQGGYFQFDKRSRQPPQDAVNALMSLSYTLAQSQATQLALHAGLDVQVGFLHGIHRDRPSLALDLIEPARAALDDWIYSLLTAQQLIQPTMFSQREDGSVWLSKEGRAVFYPAWFRDGCRTALNPIRRLLAGILAVLRHAA